MKDTLMMTCLKKWIIPATLALVFACVYEMFILKTFLMDDILATEHIWRDWQNGIEQAHIYAAIAGILMMFTALKIFKVGYNNTGLMEGIRFGALLGLFVGLMMFAMQGVLPISFELAAKLLVFPIIEFMGIGFIFAFTASKCPICSK